MSALITLKISDSWAEGNYVEILIPCAFQIYVLGQVYMSKYAILR